MSTPKWDTRFMELAQLVSTWSKDPSTKVGAVIVSPHKTVTSVGFNGFPQGMSDAEELYADREVKYSRVVHGEINALIFAEKSVRGHTLYTYPFAPCDRCCVQMIQAGIARFVFPAPTAEQIERWGPAFDKTKAYILEKGAEFLEIPLDKLSTVG